MRIEGKAAQAPLIHSSVTDAKSEAAAQQYPASGPQIPAAAAPSAALQEESEAGLHVITSPIVGTFYRAPNPEAEPFVNVGDRVSKGKVLCIVEAMKLMNEIECDADGVVARIYPQNGQPIEYGEKLFAIRV